MDLGLDYSIDFDAVKSMTTYDSVPLTLFADGIPFDLTNAKSVTIKIGDTNGYIADYPVDITTDRSMLPNGIVNIQMKESFMQKLPPNIYYLEVWVEIETGRMIFPSNGVLPFTVDGNLMNDTDDGISRLSLYQFTQNFNELSNLIMKKVGGISKDRIAIDSMQNNYQSGIDSMSDKVNDTIKGHENDVANYINSNKGAITSLVSANQSSVADFISQNRSSVADFIKDNEDKVASFIDRNKGNIDDFIDKNKDVVNDFVNEHKSDYDNFVQQHKGSLDSYINSNESSLTSITNSTTTKMDSYFDLKADQNSNFVDSLLTKASSTVDNANKNLNVKAEDYDKAKTRFDNLDAQAIDLLGSIEAKTQSNNLVYRGKYNDNLKDLQNKLNGWFLIENNTTDKITGWNNKNSVVIKIGVEGATYLFLEDTNNNIWYSHGISNVWNEWTKIANQKDIDTLLENKANKTDVDSKINELSNAVNDNIKPSLNSLHDNISSSLKDNTNLINSLTSSVATNSQSTVKTIQDTNNDVSSIKKNLDTKISPKEVQQLINDTKKEVEDKSFLYRGELKTSVLDNKLLDGYYNLNANLIGTPKGFSGWGKLEVQHVFYNVYLKISSLEGDWLNRKTNDGNWVGWTKNTTDKDLDSFIKKDNLFIKDNHDGTVTVNGDNVLIKQQNITELLSNIPNKRDVEMSITDLNNSIDSKIKEFGDTNNKTMSYRGTYEGISDIYELAKLKSGYYTVTPNFFNNWSDEDKKKYNNGLLSLKTFDNYAYATLISADGDVFFSTNVGGNTKWNVYRQDTFEKINTAIKQNTNDIKQNTTTINQNTDSIKQNTNLLNSSDRYCGEIQGNLTSLETYSNSKLATYTVSSDKITNGPKDFKGSGFLVAKSISDENMFIEIFSSDNNHYYNVCDVRNQKWSEWKKIPNSTELINMSNSIDAVSTDINRVKGLVDSMPSVVTASNKDDAQNKARMATRPTLFVYPE